MHVGLCVCNQTCSGFSDYLYSPHSLEEESTHGKDDCDHSDQSDIDLAIVISEKLRSSIHCRLFTYVHALTQQTMNQKTYPWNTHPDTELTPCSGHLRCHHLPSYGSKSRRIDYTCRWKTHAMDGTYTRTNARTPHPHSQTQTQADTYMHAHVD